MRLRVNNALLHKLGFVQPLYTFILPGFGVVRGRILVFFHWLAWSPLQQSRTTVRVYDPRWVFDNVMSVLKFHSINYSVLKILKFSFFLRLCCDA